MDTLFHDYDALYQALGEGSLAHWAATLPPLVAEILDPARHGDIPHWQQAIDSLPGLDNPQSCLDADWVQVDAELSPQDREALEAALRALHPWRKGPFRLCGILLDAEWRSNLKWARIQDRISPLEDRLVLDVGCGNGYYALRMLGAGARRVIGIDPSLRFVYQFAALKKLFGPLPAHVLPLGLEQLPEANQAFDTVFSMGVLYHRRSPFAHLARLKDCLKPGGELILETLVIAGEEGRVLVPEGRYAQMRNIWFIPSPDTLISWLRRAGFKAVRLLDVTATSTREQRATDWMRFHSLTDFLDPQNPQQTLEGHPAPVRAVVVAQK